MNESGSSDGKATKRKKHRLETLFLVYAAINEEKRKNLVRRGTLVDLLVFNVVCLSICIHYYSFFL